MELEPGDTTRFEVGDFCTFKQVTGFTYVILEVSSTGRPYRVYAIENGRYFTCTSPDGWDHALLLEKGSELVKAIYG